MKLLAFPKNGYDKCGVKTNTRVTGYSQRYKEEVFICHRQVTPD